MIASTPSSENPGLGFTHALDGNFAPSAVGGPVLDTNGAVVGVAGKSANGDICCINNSQLQRLVDAAANGELLELHRGMLGIRFDSDKDAGIINVQPDSPAAKAGIEIGDKIHSIGDFEIKNSEDVLAAVGMYRADEQITVTIKRDDQLIESTLVLTKQPQSKISIDLKDQFRQQAFKLQDGQLIPIGGNDNPKARMQLDKVLPQVFRQLDGGELFVPQLRGKLEGIEIERSGLEDAMRKLELEKQEQANEIRELKRQLKKLQSELLKEN